MKDLLAQQLEAFVKTLKAKRPEWDLIGDASVTAQQAGLQRLHELLLEVYDAPRGRTDGWAINKVQKVLRLQWPELELALQAAKDLGWRMKLGRSFTTWTVQTTTSLYGPQAAGRGTALLAEFTLDVRCMERVAASYRSTGIRVTRADLYDLYLAWPSKFKLTVPALQQELLRQEAAYERRRARQLPSIPQRLDTMPLWAVGPAQLDDVLDDEALEAGYRVGQTHEVGLLCSHMHNCPYDWRSMVALYEHAPFWFACVHDVIAQTEEIVGG